MVFVITNDEAETIKQLSDDNKYRINRLETQNIDQDGTLYSLDALNELLEHLTVYPKELNLDGLTRVALANMGKTNVFMSHFIESFLHADDTNKALLAPLMRVMIEKYRLSV